MSGGWQLWKERDVEGKCIVWNLPRGVQTPSWITEVPADFRPVSALIRHRRRELGGPGL